MIILLSPAKTITNKAPIKKNLKTLPEFLKQADEIAFYMTQYSVQDLKHILKLNSKLAFETYQRFQEFHSEDNLSLQSIMAYTGMVFKQIHPDSFNDEDFIFAQDHLRIVSFLYGLLRPLDLIKPYRMELDVILPGLNEENMHSYWAPKLTQRFIDFINKDDGVLLNLGSMEIRSVFNWKEISNHVRIITIDFKVIKNGHPKTIVIYAKMARGQMTRYMIKNRLSDPEELKYFSWEGFTYNEDLSNGDNWIFIQQ